MRHRDRAAGGNLGAEDGDDAAIASKHISKTYGHILRSASLKRTDEHLSYPFGQTHDACRPYGFVRRDHHEFVDAELAGEGGYVISTENVILNGFEQMRLHHRNVLVSGSVEDNCREV